MSVVLPQVIVFQDFSLLPTEITDPLRAFIFGPEYELHRYVGGAASEKTLVTSYVPGADIDYGWSALGKSAGAIIDQDYTRVFVKNALLQYYDDDASNSGSGASSSIYGGYAKIAVVAGYKNKIRLDAVTVKATTGYPLNSVFNGRDVKVGDVARISTGSTTIDAIVLGFEADTNASSISNYSADSNNATSPQLASATVTAATGNTLTAAATNAYDGRAVGLVGDTYRIDILKTAADKNPSQTALRITSSSGLDNVAYYVPTATDFSTAVPIGNLGLTLTFSSSSTDTFVAGTYLTVVVKQAYTQPTVTINTTEGYTGPKDTVYIVEVTQGGADAQFTVTTTNGVDSSGPVDATSETTLPIGNYGVTLTTGATVGFCKGDRFYISAAAADAGAVRTLVLDRSLPTAILNATDLNLKLMMKKDIEVLASQIDVALDNWSQTADILTVSGLMYGYSSDWVDSLGALIGMIIRGGDVYVHYRALVQTNADVVHAIEQVGDVATTFATPLDPDNPLVYGVNKALLNANGTAVRFMGVSTNDLAGYLKVLSAATSHEDVYFFVPLTFDLSIQQEVAGHVRDESAPEIGLWRRAFVGIKRDNPQAIVIGADEYVTATVTDNELTTVTTDNTMVDSDNADFITNGVQAGDVLRVNFLVDANGNESYDSFVVDAVLTENQLRLVSGPTRAISDQAVRIEIWRTLSGAQQATQVAGKAGAFGTSRVCAVFPDTISSGGVMVDGFYLAAALAGLASGVVPHQGLTNVAITGFDNAYEVSRKFSRSELDTMATGGVWLVTNDPISNEVYTRREITTDTSDLNMLELMIGKNVDAISYIFRNNLKKYIGRTNITPSLIDVIRTEVAAIISYLRSSSFTPTLGSQLIDGSIAEIRQHAFLKDRLVIVLTLTIPYPLNTIELHLVV